MGATRTQEDPKKNVAVKSKFLFEVGGEGWGGDGGPSITGSVFAATAEDQPNSEIDSSEVKYLNLCPGGFGGTTKLEEVFLPTLTESTTPHTRMSLGHFKSIINSLQQTGHFSGRNGRDSQEDPKKNVAVKFQVSSILQVRGRGKWGWRRTTKLEKVFLPTLTESTTPHTRKPRDISEASLIPSNKWDTSSEEMGVTRTQEEVPKKTSPSNSEFLRRRGRVGVAEVPQLRGRCLQQQEKINPTPKLILRKREVKYLNLCPGGFGGTTKLEVFLPTLTESTTPHTRMPQDISKTSLCPSNKWDTSAEEMGVSRTQEDPDAVKFKFLLRGIFFCRRNNREEVEDERKKMSIFFRCAEEKFSFCMLNKDKCVSRDLEAPARKSEGSRQMSHTSLSRLSNRLQPTTLTRGR
ncbi:hypothetical protein CEXT_69571 [Caerostris extrusa]|uniref:Uncharacterized protein n=1 Tax=Caerostris extrusa TaxID=172846 RepID=A0AAV4TCJ5_CAEEX|nr:hypothetical protein CEXT_69571 [Caerostris extrusa]